MARARDTRTSSQRYLGGLSNAQRKRVLAGIAQAVQKVGGTSVIDHLADAATDVDDRISDLLYALAEAIDYPDDPSLEAVSGLVNWKD